VSRYQEGKTNLDFTNARDSEWPAKQQQSTEILLQWCQHKQMALLITYPQTSQWTYSILTFDLETPDENK